MPEALLLLLSVRADLCVRCSGAVAKPAGPAWANAPAIMPVTSKAQVAAVQQQQLLQQQGQSGGQQLMSALLGASMAPPPPINSAEAFPSLPGKPAAPPGGWVQQPGAKAAAAAAAQQAAAQAAQQAAAQAKAAAKGKKGKRIADSALLGFSTGTNYSVLEKLEH